MEIHFVEGKEGSFPLKFNWLLVKKDFGQDPNAKESCKSFVNGNLWNGILSGQVGLRLNEWILSTLV